MTNTAGMIGAAGGGAPLALLVAGIGWRASLGLLGGVGVVLGVLILLFVRDHPPATSEVLHPDETRSRSLTGTAKGWREGEVSNDRSEARSVEVRSDRTPTTGTDSGSITTGLRKIIASRQAWVNALYATAISIVFVAFGALWGASFVEKACGVSRLAASAAVSLLFLGAIPGSMFFGWVSDRIRRRRAPMLAAAVGGLTCMCAMLYLPGLSFTGLRLLLAALGFFCSANIISYAVSHEISSPRRAGLSLGFLNTCFYAGSAISQPLVGKLLDLRSAARGGAGMESLTAGDFRYALSSVVAALLLSVVAALLLEESHPGAGNADTRRRFTVSF
jgi:sugar phosphate permease